MKEEKQKVMLLEKEWGAQEKAKVATAFLVEGQQNKKAVDEGKKIVRKASKKKTTLKQTLEKFLSLEVAVAENERTEAYCKELGIAVENLRIDECIIISHILKALNGEVKSFEIIRDLLGENSKEKGKYASEKMPIIQIVRKE